MLFYFFVSGDELELHYIKHGTYSQMDTDIDPYRLNRKSLTKKILKLNTGVS